MKRLQTLSLRFAAALLLFLAPSAVFAQNYTWSGFAGTAGSYGSSDGAGSSARFGWEGQLASDPAGNVYVADASNHVIRKISPGGVVTTVAGLVGASGYVDGKGAAARLSYPTGVAVDSKGNVFVADFYNNAIRKITPDGTVSTLAGLGGYRLATYYSSYWNGTNWVSYPYSYYVPNSGSADGQGTAARFYGPKNLAVGPDDTLYVSDLWNRTVRRVTTSGAVTTLAGMAGTYGGPVDGKGSTARFRNVEGIAVDAAGNVYVADGDGRAIRKITADGTVTTFAGSLDTGGQVDGVGATARFNYPLGLVTDKTNALFVTDQSGQTIRRIALADGAVTTIAGQSGNATVTDGVNTAARFFSPNAVAVDSLGNLFVRTRYSIRRGEVSRPLVPPTITTVQLAAPTEAAAYSQNLTATGGQTPYAWRVASGALPGGLTLNATSGLLAGKPAAPGNFTFTVEVQGSDALAANQTYTMVVFPRPVPPTITTARFDDATVGSAYLQNLAATGGATPYAWSLAGGRLPAGLTLTAQGVITGTPTAAGPVTFSVRVLGSNGLAATRVYSLIVDPKPDKLEIASEDIALGTVGSPFRQALVAAGGTKPYASWDIASGSLPPGLVLSNAGVLLGTPTTSGAWAARIRVTDKKNVTAVKSFSFSVRPKPTPPTISADTLPGGTVDAVYTQTFSASGGATPYSWSLPAGSVLPAGLTLNAGGVLSGTPTTSGAYAFSVQARGSNGLASTQEFTMQIAEPPSVPPVIMSSLNVAGTVGAAFDQTLVATGSSAPYTWEVVAGGLPNGLELNSSGRVTGTPTTAGTTAATIKVTSRNLGTVTGEFSFVIAPAVTVETASLGAATTGLTYSATLAASGGVAPYAWAVSAGTLPAGLSLTSAGVISGTPTAVGNASLIVRVSDANGVAATRLLALSVVTPPSVTTAQLPVGTAGLAYNAPLAAAGATTPYAWSLAAGTLPAGVSLSGDGILSGTPSSAGSSPITVRVTGANGIAATKALTVVVAPPPAVATATLPGATVGLGYNQTLTATGSTQPYSWRVSAGALPAGLSLSAAGVISGAPTAPGSSSVTVEVAGANGATAKREFNLSVVPKPEITTADLGGATVGVAFSRSLAATGATLPYAWRVATGILPAGLTFSAEGVLSGTPTAATTSNLTLQVTGANGVSATRAFTLVVAPTPVISTTRFNPGTVGLTFNQTMVGAGGRSPYSWEIASGVLPDGISLSPSGVLSGTPTTPGTARLTVRLTDALGVTATKDLTFAVVPMPVISAAELPGGTVGQAYSTSIVVNGGTAPFGWALTQGTAPVGLSLNATTGTLVGVPSAAGNFSFTVRATDANGIAATQTLSLRVVPPPSITNGALPAATVGTPYLQPFTATGGRAPYTWSVIGSLPAGLTLSAEGSLSGTPTAAQNANFIIRVAGSDGIFATKSFALVVAPQPAISTPALGGGTVGLSYNRTLTGVGGTTPYSWSVVDGALPAGLSLSSGGVLSGTPTTPQAANFTVQMLTSTGVPATKGFTLTVTPPPVIDTVTLPPATLGANYSQGLAGSAGALPYAWRVASGVLPAGLTLTSSGVLSGIPTAVGNSTFSVLMTDGVGATVSRSLAVRVVPVTAVVSTSLLNGEVGRLYSQTLQASGGVAPYTWEIAAGSLPAGLRFGSDGTLQGTPTAAGATTLTFKVTAANGVSAQRSLALTIIPPPSVVSPGPTTRTVGGKFVYAFSAKDGVPPYAWSVDSSTSLPAGWSLSAVGVLSGTPSRVATEAFTVRVTDANGISATRPVSVDVVAAPVIVTEQLRTGSLGYPFSQQLAASGGVSPYLWSLASGALPAGMTISQGGLLTGTPTGTGVASFTLRMSDINGSAVTKAYTLTVTPAPRITTPSLSTASVGNAYSLTLAASGGTEPYAWSLAAGSLPAGLTLGGNGVISGTPIAAATANITIRVTGSNDAAATKPFTLTVVASPAISTTTIANALAGVSYTQALVATGGLAPYVWTLVDGTLPTGLTLSSAGVISGTPTTGGQFNLRFRVTDSRGGYTERAFDLGVGAAPVIDTDALARGTAGENYTQNLRATGGKTPYTWQVASGILPAGLTLSGDGVLLGAPTTAGNATLVVRVTGSDGATSTRTLALAVDPAPVPPTITTGSLPAGVVGTSYTANLSATGGVSGYSWSVPLGSLPPGLALSPSGALTGLPTVSGNFSFTVQVTGGDGLLSVKGFAINVSPAPTAPTVATSALPAGTVNSFYRVVLTASGGTAPYTWAIAAGTLPPGLTFASNGAISGVPDRTGTWGINFRVTGANGLFSIKGFSITISAAPTPPTITSALMATWTAEQNQSLTLAASGGSQPYTWSTSANLLPPGVTFTSAGVLSGTPSVAATTAFPVTVTGSDGQSSSRNFTLIVNPKPEPPTITTSALPTAVAGLTYNQTLTASGGKAPYSWSIKTGGLPLGLVLSANGTITGSPVGSGNGSFTLQVAGADGLTSTSDLSLVVTDAPNPNSKFVLASPGGARSAIFKYDTTDGTATALIPATEFAGVQRGIAVTADGTLHVVDTDPSTKASRIVKFNATTTAKVGEVTNPSLTSVAYLAVDSAGNLYVNRESEAGSPAVLKLGPAGQSLGAINPGAFGNATITAVDALDIGPDGRLYLVGRTGAGNLAVLRFTTALQFVDVFVPNAGPAAAGATAPIWNLEGNLVLGVRAAGVIREFNARGQLVREVVRPGTDGPSAIVFAPSGDLLVQVQNSTKEEILRVKGDATGAVTPFTNVNQSIFDFVPLPRLPEVPVVTTGVLAEGMVGSSYGQGLLASGGTPPYRFTLAEGSLPLGINLAESGVLSGTPVSPGSSDFTVRVTGFDNLSSTKNLTLTVRPQPAPPTITTQGVPSAVEGTPFQNFTFDATGAGPFRWSVVGGSLPPGLDFNVSGAVLSGTPTAFGEWSVTLRVTDVNNRSTDATFVIVVEAKPGTFPPPWYSPRVLTFGDDVSTIAAEAVSATGRVIGSFYISDPNWTPDPNLPLDGQVAPEVKRAFLWADGSTLTLLPAGALDSAATDINNQGQVVGSYTPASPSLSRAFVWQDGVFTTLLPPGATQSSAEAINESGQVAGSMKDGEGFSAFVWSNGTFQKLRPVANQPTNAIDIGDGGHVLGVSYDVLSGASRTFLWKDGVYTYVEIPGAVSISAFAVGADGSVVGSFVNQASQSRAFLWKDGVVTSLHPDGSVESSAYAITPSGYVAGSSADATGTSSAFLWKDGQFLVLSTRVPNSVTVNEAYAINNQGLVVVLGTNADGDQNLYLLKPESSPRPALPVVSVTSGLTVNTTADEVTIRGTVTNGVTKVVYRSPDDDFDNLATGTSSWNFVFDTVDVGTYVVYVIAEGPGGRSVPVKVTIKRQ